MFADSVDVCEFLLMLPRDRSDMENECEALNGRSVFIREGLRSIPERGSSPACERFARSIDSHSQGEERGAKIINVCVHFSREREKHLLLPLSLMYVLILWRLTSHTPLILLPYHLLPPLSAINYDRSWTSCANHFFFRQSRSPSFLPCNTLECPPIRLT